VRYCSRCILPDTRPGIEIDSDGVCSSCLAHGRREDVDWDARRRKFEEIVQAVRARKRPYDCVIPVWLMLQQDEPDDYVIATGRAHSVRNLVEIAFDHVGLVADDHIRIDERYLRPAEVEHLVGDFSKARQQLGWEPQKSFEDMVRRMVDADLELLASGAPRQQAG
jgi:nucleoside-diphosphate-sugar epimerase